MDREQKTRSMTDGDWGGAARYVGEKGGLRDTIPEDLTAIAIKLPVALFFLAPHEVWYALRSPPIIIESKLLFRPNKELTAV